MNVHSSSIPFFLLLFLHKDSPFYDDDTFFWLHFNKQTNKHNNDASYYQPVRKKGKVRSVKPHFAWIGGVWTFGAAEEKSFHLILPLSMKWHFPASQGRAELNKPRTKFFFDSGPWAI
jgi:hypothetical protein